MRKKKYLPLYESLMYEGRLTFGAGLCLELSMRHLDVREFEELFEPPEKFYRYLPTAYWGSGVKDRLLGEFTALRENMLLLMAAMNNEL
jgi:hypothetical protein